MIHEEFNVLANMSAVSPSDIDHERGSCGMRDPYDSRLSLSSGVSSQNSSLAGSRDESMDAEMMINAINAADTRAKNDPLDFLVKDWWAHKDSPETEKMTPLTPKLSQSQGTDDDSSTEGLRTPLANGLRAIRQQCKKGAAEDVQVSKMSTPDLRTPIR